MDFSKYDTTDKNSYPANFTPAQKEAVQHLAFLANVFHMTDDDGTRKALSDSDLEAAIAANSNGSEQGKFISGVMKKTLDARRA